MAAFKIPFIESKSLTKGYFDGIPSFRWCDVVDKDEIGRGSFGSVLKATYVPDNKTVVVKRFFGEGDSNLKNVVKEAKLLQNVHHPKVAEFIGVCAKPVSIMMAYECFDFKPFGLDHQVSDLLGFLHCLDQLESSSPDAFENFLLMFPKAASDIAEGLAFLHSKNIVHRDLKPGNVLVSNKHYLQPGIDQEQFKDLFCTDPVICKLTDFGESRSHLLQTHAIIHAQTANMERGTKPFMAPEIVCENRKPNHVTLEDMKAIDVWALGMTLFNVVNPDLDYPYEIELKSSCLPSDPDLARSRFQRLLQEKMENEIKPESSRKYHRLQASEWNRLEEVFHKCTNFEASLRPTAQDVILELSANNGKDFAVQQISLGVSQATPLEEFDRKVADALVKGTSKTACRVSEKAPLNDGTDACTFLCLAAADKLLNADHKGELTDDWQQMVPRIFSDIIENDLAVFNRFREKRPYDGLECLTALKREALLPETAELLEKIIAKDAVFSPRGRANLLRGLRESSDASSTFWLYTCEPYTFLLGEIKGKYFILDPNPVPEFMGGDGNGLLSVFPSTDNHNTEQVCKWIWKRLAKASVCDEAAQSLSLVVLPDLG